MDLIDGDFRVLLILQRQPICGDVLLAPPLEVLLFVEVGQSHHEALHILVSREFPDILGGGKNGEGGAAADAGEKCQMKQDPDSAVQEAVRKISVNWADRVLQ